MWTLTDNLLVVKLLVKRIEKSPSERSHVCQKAELSSFHHEGNKAWNFSYRATPREWEWFVTFKCKRGFEKIIDSFRLYSSVFARLIFSFRATLTPINIRNRNPDYRLWRQIMQRLYCMLLYTFCHEAISAHSSQQSLTNSWWEHLRVREEIRERFNV